MNRLAEELPVVHIKSTETYHPSESLNGCIIQVTVCGYSSGFIKLDRTEDLFRLRDAIDSYIRKHDIKPSNHIDHE